MKYRYKESKNRGEQWSSPVSSLYICLADSVLSELLPSCNRDSTTALQIWMLLHRGCRNLRTRTLHTHVQPSGREKPWSRCIFQPIIQPKVKSASVSELWGWIMARKGFIKQTILMSQRRWPLTFHPIRHLWEIVSKTFYMTFMP